jgi:hypothetical protein
MMCRPLCVDHVAPAAERFGADSEITDAKKLYLPGGFGRVWKTYPQINKRRPAQRAGLSAEETKVYALTLIVASALFSPSALTVSVTVPPA